MVNILFICHGNICRSPMAEFIMKKLVKERHLEDSIYVESAAASLEEIGNDIYPPARRKLTEMGVEFEKRAARRTVIRDYDRFDLIIIMDSENLCEIMRIFGRDDDDKIHKLLDFCGRPGEDVSDPWYTRDFDKCYDDIYSGCFGLLSFLVENKSAPALKIK